MFAKRSNLLASLRYAAPLSAVILCGSASAQVDVLTQHNDNGRTGVNLRETELVPSAVNKARFGMLFKRVVDDQLYTQPLVVTGVRTGGGTRDLVLVTTVNNSVYAFDANDPEESAPVWHVNFGTPPNVHSTDFGCMDINGQMGIIGTPVVDKGSGALYVVALTRAGAGYIQRLHALDLATGADLPQSPVTVKAEGFDPLMQNQRPALLLAAGTVYVGYASHCDKEPYHGFLFAYDSRTLEQRAVLNTSPTGSGSSIWQSGQGPGVDVDGNIHVVTGNGSWDGARNFSESFLKLSPELKLLDWFTPTNHFELDRRDDDLDSSGATLIPGTRLVIGGGKEGVLYLLDKDHFGHLGDEHAIQHFKATASHLHSLVYWESAAKGRLLYVWGQRDKAKVYRFDGERLGETPVMMREVPNEGHPGAMLSLSANGGHDGILWAAIHATGDSWHESRPGVLHAYDADDITHELWNSLQVPQRDDCGEYSKMAPPTIANGRVYLASFGTENVGSGQMCVYGVLPGGAVHRPAAPSGVSASVQPGGVALMWSPVPGARAYRVLRTSSQEPRPTIVARGLTTPRYTEPAPAHGESVSYQVIAVGAGGASEASPASAIPAALATSPHDHH
ncbi:MAG: PQQ-like beta-propeller repeat protein [Acidobacteriota bacterium]|nr:PQQ-like beta-propeller repeat protein [Acidobacteriota bacterium]